MRHLSILLLALSLTFGCGDDGGTGDTGTAGDTGSAGDTSAGDTGSAGDTSAGDTGSAGDTSASDTGGTTCEQGCTLTLAADCDEGPVSMMACVTDCEMLVAGACGTEFDAYVTCGDGMTVTCDAEGQPVVAACAAERTAFIACLSK